MLFDLAAGWAEAEPAMKGAAIRAARTVPAAAVLNVEVINRSSL